MRVTKGREEERDEGKKGRQARRGQKNKLKKRGKICGRLEKVK